MSKSSHLPRGVFLSILGLCFSGSLPIVAGCNGNMRMYRTSEAYLNMALESDDPNVRREGVIGLADGNDSSTDWAIRVFDTMARTDTDAMVRCAALRALARSPQPGQVETAILLLGSAGQESLAVRPASARVRWDAAKLLLSLVDGMAYEPSQRDAIIQALLERIRSDRDRNVRLTVIETLAYFQEPSVPTGLVDVMRTDDFAIQRAAEQSLVALTGATHHHDPDAWAAWLDRTEDPFAGPRRLAEDWDRKR